MTRLGTDSFCVKNDTFGDGLEEFKNETQKLNGMCKDISVEVIKYLKKLILENLNKNEIAFEDLAPLMYLQYKTYTTLKKTYRTTKEIMDVANSGISKLPDQGC